MSQFEIVLLSSVVMVSSTFAAGMSKLQEHISACRQTVSERRTHHYDCKFNSIEKLQTETLAAHLKWASTRQHLQKICLECLATDIPV